jgi:tRNA-dihydrouridine synthase B
LARGSLGNPWLFGELLGLREGEPHTEEILAELDWVLECAREHLGEDRATRYLRKFYPWYVERLDLPPPVAKTLQSGLQTAPTLVSARELFDGAARRRMGPALAQARG